MQKINKIKFIIIEHIFINIKSYLIMDISFESYLYRVSFGHGFTF